jgi:hypothetical protein
MRAPLKRWNHFPRSRLSAKNKQTILVLTSAAILISAIVLPSYLPFAVFENKSEVNDYGLSAVTVTTVALYPDRSAVYKVYTKIDHGLGFPMMSLFYFPWSFFALGPAPTSSTLKYDARIDITNNQEIALKIIKGSPSHEAKQIAKAFGGDAPFGDEFVPDIKVFRLQEDGLLVDGSGTHYKRKWDAFYNASNRLRAIFPNFKKLFSASN